MITIPINLGFWQLKSIQNQVFKTRIRRNVLDNIGKGVNCDLFEYNDEKCIIGDGNVQLNYDKADDDFMLYCTLNMLARFIDEDKCKESFKLILTSPPLTYESAKEKFPKYFIGEYNIIHNGTHKYITIEEVEVYAETFIAFLNNNPNDYLSDNLAIIDIGGLTTNVTRIIKGNFSCTEEYYLTLRTGMYNVDTKIAQHLNKKYIKYNFDFEDDDIVDFRENGLYIMNNYNTNIMEVEKEDINNIYHEHVKSILENIKKKNWNFGNYKILVTGGGGNILYPTIKHYFPQAKIGRDPIFDNLKGLEILSE